MTENEQILLRKIDTLYEAYNDDNMSNIEIENFNIDLHRHLKSHNISLDRYHELLLERIED